MRPVQPLFVAIALLGVLSSPSAAQQGEQVPMTFFITSVGSGNGANLGGLLEETHIASSRPLRLDAAMSRGVRTSARKAQAP